MSVEELREVFDQFDENGDGQLSLEEFAQAFRALYVFSPSTATRPKMKN
jgi:Ca2+-binding EF-hand superfamily protein